MVKAVTAIFLDSSPLASEGPVLRPPSWPGPLVPWGEGPHLALVPLGALLGTCLAAGPEVLACRPRWFCSHSPGSWSWRVIVSFLSCGQISRVPWPLATTVPAQSLPRSHLLSFSPAPHLPPAL